MELSVEVGAAVVVVVWCGGWLAVLSLSLTLWGGKARPKLLLALRGNGGGLRLCFMGFPGGGEERAGAVVGWVWMKCNKEMDSSIVNTHMSCRCNKRVNVTVVWVYWMSGAG